MGDRDGPRIMPVTLLVVVGPLLWVMNPMVGVRRSLLGAMVGVHTGIGIGEGVITALVVGSVLALRPDLVRGAADAAPPAPLELRTGSVA